MIAQRLPRPLPRALLSSLFAALLTLLCAGAAQAHGGEEARTLVRDTSQRMLATLRDERERIDAEPRLIYSLVDQIVLPHFDFQRMARWVLGKHWRRADEAQRERFVQAFRTLLVRTYATALNEYADTPITYPPIRAAEGSQEVTVKSVAEVAGGLPVPVDYKLHHQGDAWKVYDVAIDGLSLVTNYRSSFSKEIRRRGIDGLIDKLAARNRQANQ